MMTSTHIGFLIYPGVIQLDVMGPYQVLSFPPDVTLHLVSQDHEVVASNEGFQFLPTNTFEDCPPLDILVVPGGGLGQVSAMGNDTILDFLRTQGQSARYIASVCTGSLILAAAGLLNGYQATGHWVFQDQLARLGVDVIHQRVVVDRNRLTCAGVTAGIDMGLQLLALIWGEDLAKSAQLMLEYDPAPPFAGSPQKADEQTITQLLEYGRSLIDSFKDQVQRLADQKI